MKISDDSVILYSTAKFNSDIADSTSITSRCFVFEATTLWRDRNVCIIIIIINDVRQYCTVMEPIVSADKQNSTCLYPFTADPVKALHFAILV